MGERNPHQKRYSLMVVRIKERRSAASLSEQHLTPMLGSKHYLDVQPG